MTPARRRPKVRESRAHYDVPDAFLLDTHIWLRLLAPELGSIPKPVAAVLAEAQQRSALIVSDVSVWELALKVGRGSLVLSLPLRAWLNKAVEAPGIQHIAISRDCLLCKHETDMGAVKDPFDRALIATALTTGATLVTADRTILRWASRGGVSVLAAR